MIEKELLKTEKRKTNSMREKKYFFFLYNPHSIMPVLFKYFLTLFFVCTMIAAKAQESMMAEVNYTFLQKLIDTAKVRYPKMKTFDHRVIIAQEDLKKTKLSWFDLLTFSLSYSPSGATTIVSPTLSGYQVGIFFNMASLIQKPHIIKQAKEEVSIAKLNLEEYNLNIEAEVKSRYFKYIQYITVIRLRTQSLNDAEGLLKQTKFKFEKGEETFENYSKALMTYTDHKNNIIEAETELLIAKSNLEEIIGKKLEDIH